MADYNSDRTGSNIDLTLDKVDALDAKVQPTATGANVTGTLTADGLVVEGTIASPSALKISNTGGSWNTGDEVGRIQFYTTDGSGIGEHETASIRAVTNQGGVQTDGTLEFWRSPYNSNVVKALEIDGATGDVSFYEDTGTTAKFVWDSSLESLGIGNAPISSRSGLYLAGTEKIVQIGNDGGGQTATMGALTTSSIGVNDYGCYFGYDSFYDHSNGKWKPLRDSLGRKFIQHYSYHQGKYRLRYLENVQSEWDDSAWDDLVTLDIVTGNLGVGADSPSAKIHLNGTGATDAKLQMSSGTGLASIDGRYGNLVISADENNAVGGSVIAFRMDNSEAMRLDNSRNLLVGKTSANFGVAGTEMKQSGLTQMTRSGNKPLALNRLTNDGSILEFYKDSSIVGSITANSNRIGFGGGATGLRMHDDITSVLPYNPTTGGNQFDTISLGHVGTRFKDLYLSGGVYLGGTGAANKLDDYEEGTFTPVARGSTTAGTGTYSQQAGRYTKIGNKVSIEIVLAWSAHTGSGGMQIDGLPFNTNGNRQTFAMTAQNLTYTGEVKVLSYFGNDNFLQLFQQTSNSSLSELPMDSTVDYMVITGMYETDS